MDFPDLNPPKNKKQKSNNRLKSLTEKQQQILAKNKNLNSNKNPIKEYKKDLTNIHKNQLDPNQLISLNSEEIVNILQKRNKFVIEKIYELEDSISGLQSSNHILSIQDTKSKLNKEHLVLDSIVQNNKELKETNHQPTKLYLLDLICRLPGQDLNLLTDKTLMVKNEDGYSLAHCLATKHQRFENTNILDIEDNSGYSVTHSLAHQQDWNTNEMSLLSKQTKKGLYVAHIIAEKKEILNPEAYKLKNQIEDTTAHILADRGVIIKDPEIQKLTNIYGVSVAHNLAKNKYLVKDKEIQSQQDQYGISVLDQYNIATNF